MVSKSVNKPALEAYYLSCLLIHICYRKYCVYLSHWHWLIMLFISIIPSHYVRSKLKTKELSKTSKAESVNIINIILDMLITCSATLTLTFRYSSKHWYTFPESIKKCWYSRSLLTFHLHSVSSCFVLSQQDHIKTI